MDIPKYEPTDYYEPKADDTIKMVAGGIPPELDLIRRLNILIPKLEREFNHGKSARQVNDEKIELAVAIKDFLDTGDDVRLSQL